MMICMTAWERGKGQNYKTCDETLETKLYTHFEVRIFSLNTSIPYEKDPNGACLSLMTQEPAVSITIN